jgi:hypothetical protein
MHHGVFVYCDVTPVSKVGMVAFLLLVFSHLLRLYIAAPKVGLLTETALHYLTLIKNKCRWLCGYRTFLNYIFSRSDEINASPTKDVPRLFLAKHYSFHLKNR